MRGRLDNGGPTVDRFRAGLVAGAGVLALSLATTGWTGPVERPLRDAGLRLLPPVRANRVAAVVIDEDSLASVGPWPWPRPEIARLVRAVRSAGAACVVVDLLLPEERPGDDELARALAKGPSVVGAGLDGARGWIRPSLQIRRAAREGHATFELDGDGVVRRVLTTKQRDDVTLPALSLAAITLVDPDRPIPVGQSLRPDFRTSVSSIPVSGAAGVLSGRASTGSLRGRIVFVGVTAAGLGDRVVSPASRGSQEAGVLVQAAATESIWRHGILRTLPAWLTGLAAMSLAAAGTEARSTRAAPRRMLAFLPVVLLIPAGFLLLGFARLEVPVVTIGGAAFLAIVASVVASARKTEARAGEAATRLVEERRVVAHELKTPLTSVRGLAQLLESFDLSPDERRRVASMVVTETTRLSEMVEALLDVDRTRLRDFVDVAKEISLSDLVRRRVDTLGSGAGRQTRLSVEPGVVVRGDAALLERVLDNLLGNAFKFSPPETPVDVGLRTLGAEAILEVTDRGPGIPPGERKEIFRPFSRGRSGADAPGLGLGLALVEQVVTWHRGRVEVLDTAEAGASFRVRLPRANDPAMRPA